VPTKKVSEKLYINDFFEGIMALNKEEKEKLMKEFGQSEVDTGSVEVQIALLTESIKRLTEHMKEHAKDFSSKHGLLTQVSRRKSFLQYLKRKDPQKYEQVIERLGLKG
jgi:small subunit ribosomal protein S15